MRAWAQALFFLNRSIQAQSVRYWPLLRSESCDQLSARPPRYSSPCLHLTLSKLYVVARLWSSTWWGTKPQRSREELHLPGIRHGPWWVFLFNISIWAHHIFLHSRHTEVCVPFQAHVNIRACGFLLASHHRSVNKIESVDSTSYLYTFTSTSSNQDVAQILIQMR